MRRGLVRGALDSSCHSTKNPESEGGVCAGAAAGLICESVPGPALPLQGLESSSLKSQVLPLGESNDSLTPLEAARPAGIAIFDRDLRVFVDLGQRDHPTHNPVR